MIQSNTDDLNQDLNQDDQILLSDSLMDSDISTLTNRCIRYIYKLKGRNLDWSEIPNPLEIKRYDRSRLDLVKNLINSEEQGRKLFHLTVTYRPYQDRIYKESDLNNFFSNFYKTGLMPFVLNGHINNNGYFENLLFCYTFLDEHQFNPTKTKTLYGYKTGSGIRLHHHVIIDCHQDLVPKMRQLEGKNKLVNHTFSKKFETTDLKECRPTRLLYASKMFYRYPDFVMYSPIDYFNADQTGYEFIPKPDQDNFRSADVRSFRYR
jgi:hypothetical protein